MYKLEAAYHPRLTSFTYGRSERVEIRASSLYGVQSSTSTSCQWLPVVNLSDEGPGLARADGVLRRLIGTELPVSHAQA